MSQVAVRRLYTEGVVQRTISSTAVGMRDRSARRASNCSGDFESSQMPVAIALRVVSAPAVNSRLQNMATSVSSRRDGSWSGNSPWITTDSRSSRGSVVRARISRWPYWNRWALASDRTDDGTSSLKSDDVMSTHSHSAWRSSRGAPSNRQMAWSGNSAATSTTMSQLPRPPGCGATASRVRSAMASRSLLRRAIRLGVNPLLTSWRMRWWRGSSIMLRSFPLISMSLIMVPP